MFNVYKRYLRNLNLKTALKRNVSIIGIDYEVGKVGCDKSNHLETEINTIEYMYKNYTEYTNVKVEGNMLIVRSLDSVYKYDMNKIHSIYKREVLKDTSKINKAKLIGQSYNESISQNGDLHRISTSLSTVCISDKVRRICKASIQLNRRNEHLIIGANIVDIEEGAINPLVIKGSKEIVNINKAEFMGNKYIQCIENMANEIIKIWKVELIFSSELTGYQIATLVYDRFSGLTAITCANETDEIYISAIKKGIKMYSEISKLDSSLDTIRDSFSRKLYMSLVSERDVFSINEFLYKTKTIIIPKIKLSENIETANRLVNKIEMQLQFRLDELNAKLEENNKNK